MKRPTPMPTIQDCEPEMLELLDIKYLGQRYLGNFRERLYFLQDLRRMLSDPEKGPEWVAANKLVLLDSARFVLSQCLL